MTGHRSLADPQSVTARVEPILDWIEEFLSPGPPTTATPVAYTVVSALAEGADRVVAKAVLERRSAGLEVVLPMGRAEYMKDFETEQSRAEFLALLGRAELASEPGRAADRPRAYAAGGRALVDRVDVLIAVWDHEPPRGRGGTAYVVDHARRKGVPVCVVSVVDATRVDYPALPARPNMPSRILDRFDLRGGSHSRTSRLASLRLRYRQLDAFNREHLPTERLEAGSALERRVSGAAAREAGIDESFSTWILPSFVKADLFAAFYQWLYTRLALSVFLIAALAVLVSAGLEIYGFANRGSLIEVSLMLLILILVALARWKRAHERWISYRSLAENLRSAPYLALLGNHPGARSLGIDSFSPWFQRAFTEIWNERPVNLATPADKSLLARFFDVGWIQRQIDYHDKTSREFDRRHRALTGSILVLFLSTFTAACLDASGIGTKPAVFLAISLPAFGAALGGYRELRQFGIHSERYARAKDRLEDLRSQMHAEETPDAVRSCAARAYAVMLEEETDWFGVLEFADLEIVI